MKATALPKQPAAQPDQPHQNSRPGYGWLRPLASAWRAISSSAPRPCVPMVEEFETRLLYSADFAPNVLALAATTQIVEQRVLDSSGEFIQNQTSQTNVTEQKHELLFIESDVPDSQKLMAGLDTQGRSIEIVYLDASKDGIAQISAALAGRTDLSAIHLFTHGSSGLLQLGSTTLDNSQLDTRSAEITRWGDALSVDADILLYGCDVATGVDGQNFVQRLALLTRADVSASDDLTGNAALGGNWKLEYSAGQIESRLAFNTVAQAQWQGLLETLANTTLAPHQTQTAVAMNPTSGSYVVSWTADSNQDGDNDGVFARIYNSAGTPISSEIAVNSTIIKAQSTPAVGMAADGSFVIAWQSDAQDGDKFGIFAQRFSAAGAKVGGEILVNQYTTGNQAAPSIAVAADGQFVVAWEDDRNGGDIYARHFSNTGVALSNEILVNTNTASGQHTPAVAIDSTGNYVVTWESDSGATGKAVFAQRFNTSDAKLGSEFRINTYDSSDQIDPAIAMAPDGSFVITWSSNNQDGNSYGVYAQRYAADGTKAGGEFIVNTTTNHKQDASAAVMDGSGNFVIVWESDNQDGDKLGIYARRYFANGVANGGEFLVNTTTHNDQRLPATAISSAGDLVIVWEGEGTGDDKGIFLQNYVMANNPPVAVADTANTDEDTPTSGAAPGILGNDSDPDAGAVLTVSGIRAGTTGTSTIVITGGVTVNGTYGSLLIQQDGSYTYTPNLTTAQALAAGQAVTDVFTYTIKDEKNANASTTLTVTINGLNDAPTANVDSYAVVKSGTLNIAATGVLSNDTDVDINPVADILTVAQVNGLAGNVGASVIGIYGTLILNANGSLSYAPNLANPIVSGLVGNIVDNFTYQVADGKGGTSTAALNITISGTNTAPVANNDTYTTDEDVTLSVPANGVINNDTDAEGNVLSATLVGNVTNGTLVFNGNGSFTYTPNAYYAGSDSFTYQVSDGSLSSGIATVTLTITPVNHAPVAFSDTGAVNQDATLVVNAAVGVLGNDTDVDTGDTKAVTLISTGASSSVVAIGTPGVLTSSYGTLTLASDGSYTYIANGIDSKALGAGQTSDDTFSYAMQDAAGASSNTNLTITITGTNDVPTLAGINATTSIDDTASATPFSAVIIGDVDKPDQTQTVSITLDLAAKGALSSLGGGSYDAVTGIYNFSGTAAAATTAVQGLVFTPAANRVNPTLTETTTFTISVYDGVAAAVTNSSTAVVTTSVNDIPVIGGATAVTNISDTATATPFSAFTITDADTAQLQTVSVTLDTAVKGGLSNLGGGAYNAGAGVYTFSGTAAAAQTAIRGLVFTPTPNRVAPGSAETTTFTVNVDDGISPLGTNNATTVVATSVNDAAVISTDSGSVIEDVSLTTGGALTIGDVDPGQSSFAAQSGTLGSYGTFSIDTAGNWSYALNNAAVQFLLGGGTLSEAFTVASVDGTTSSVILTITGTNDAPIVSAASASGAQDTGTPIAVTLTGSDVDGSIASFTLSSLPVNGTLYQDAGMAMPAAASSALAANGNTLTLYFQPAANWSGSTSFSFLATDNQGLDSGGANATLTVAATPVVVAAPVITVPTVTSPEPTSQPPVVEKTPDTPEPDKTSKASPVKEALPPDTKTNDALAAAATLLEEKTASAVATATNELATSQDRREGVRANQSTANAAELLTIDAGILAGFTAGQRSDLPLYDAITSATENRAFIQELNQLSEQMTSDAEGEKRIVGASVAAGTGLSVGYVLWLLRGGVLLSSLLSALPAWRFIDPLPVLGRMKDGDDEDDDEDDESLESLVVEQPNSVHATPEENKHA